MLSVRFMKAVQRITRSDAMGEGAYQDILGSGEDG